MRKRKRRGDVKKKKEEEEEGEEEVEIWKRIEMGEVKKEEKHWGLDME